MNLIEKEETIQRHLIFPIMVRELLHMCEKELFGIHKIERYFRDYLEEFEYKELMDIQKDYIQEVKKAKQNENIKQVQEEHIDYFTKNNNYRNKSLLLAASQLNLNQRRFSRQELVSISQSIPTYIHFRYPSSGTIPITSSSDFLSAMFLFSKQRPSDNLSKRTILFELLNSNQLFF